MYQKEAGNHNRNNIENDMFLLNHNSMYILCQTVLKLVFVVPVETWCKLRLKNSG